MVARLCLTSETCADTGGLGLLWRAGVKQLKTSQVELGPCCRDLLAGASGAKEHQAEGIIKSVA